MNTHRGTRPWADQPPGRQRPAIVPRPRFTDPGNAAEEDWRADAECAKPQYDLNTWFPIGETGEALRWIQDAKDICNFRCPVVRECATHALRVGEPYGVWGGMSESDRAALKRRAARQRQRDAS